MNHENFYSDRFIFGAIKTPERKKGYFAASSLVQKCGGIYSPFYAAFSLGKERDSIK